MVMELFRSGIEWAAVALEVAAVAMIVDGLQHRNK